MPHARMPGDRWLRPCPARAAFPRAGAGEADSCLPSPSAGIGRRLRPGPEGGREGGGSINTANSIPVTVGPCSGRRPERVCALGLLHARAPQTCRALQVLVRPGWRDPLCWGESRHLRKVCPTRDSSPSPTSTAIALAVGHAGRPAWLAAAAASQTPGPRGHPSGSPTAAGLGPLRREAFGGQVLREGQCLGSAGEQLCPFSSQPGS